jgi:hypothetical protein
MTIAHSTITVTDADGVTVVPVDNVDVSGNKRQATVIGGPQTTDAEAIAAVQAAQPAGTEMGLVVREAQKGQQTSANSQPVVLASDQSAIPVTGSLALSGSVAVSNFPTTQPVSGNVAVSNFPTTQPVSGTVTANAGTGTMAVSASALPLPSGAATAAKQPAIGTAGTPSADVISIQGEAGMTPLKVDGSAVTQPVSGTVAVNNFPGTQPVSGTVTANIGTSGSLALDASLASVKVVGGGTEATAQRVTIASDSTGVISVDDNSGSLTVDGTVTANAGTGTFAVSAASLPLPTGAASSANQSTVKAASTAAASTDTSSVIQISPNQPALTTPLNMQGAKTNNNAAPGSTNFGTLPAVANAAPQSLTEGDQQAVSMDLAGNLRIYGHPPNVLGAYMVNGRTSTYAGLSAGTPLFSFRWADATRLAVIMRVRVMVATTVTSTTNSGQVERELIVARAFTASDTGGTAVTLTGNNQKMRTSQGTSLVTDMRFGTTITAGTRTLDANPIASAVAWLGPNFTGVDIGGAGSSATAAGWVCVGGNWIDLLNATNGQTYPLVLAQNEGFIVRVGKDTMPTGFTQQTYLEVDWSEVNAY